VLSRSGRESTTLRPKAGVYRHCCQRINRSSRSGSFDRHCPASATEHREKALQDLDGCSSMRRTSTIAFCAVHVPLQRPQDEAGEATLGDVHYVVQSGVESPTHDAFIARGPATGLCSALRFYRGPYGAVRQRDVAPGADQRSLTPRRAAEEQRHPGGWRGGPPEGGPLTPPRDPATARHARRLRCLSRRRSRRAPRRRRRGPVRAVDRPSARRPFRVPPASSRRRPLRSRSRGAAGLPSPRRSRGSPAS
jgi:hypothetical protein